MGEGLVVVVEGRRVALRVFRRVFAPVKMALDGESYTVYSDTGLEREISYRNAEYYGLDDPFGRVRLLRLARAMNCLRCVDLGTGEQECTVTICLTRELGGSDAGDVWTPFDPAKLEPLKEMIGKARRRARWRRRVRG